MNKKLIILVLIIVPITAWFLMQNNSTTLQEAESGFAIKDTSLVTKIFIADMSSHSVLLARTSDGWTVNGKTKANNKIVDMLIGTMKKLKVKAPVPIVARDNVVKRLSSIGIKVEVYTNSFRVNLFDKIKLFPYVKLDKVYYVGDATPDNLGTYMLMDDAKDPYIVYIPRFRGFLTPRYSPLTDDWISHVVFHHTLSDIASVSVSFTEKPKESFKVEVIDSYGNYKVTRLLDNKNIINYDTLKMLNFLTSFSDLRYETRLNNLLRPSTIDSITHSPPMYNITLVDKNNDTVSVVGFAKRALPEEIKDEEYFKLIPDDRDRFHALINNGDDFVLMQYYVFDKVLYPLDYYTQKR